MTRIRQSTAKELKRITRPDRPRIFTAINRLSELPISERRLKGDLRGLRRLRVGDYRVVYEIQDDVLVVLVVRIAHRRNVYRRTGS